ncbi:T6SS immunity protein Tdi1 domain-containing protein [Pelistega europaea]|uniref:SMI1/KNR4 family protein n=1 Tax=Pelistega europaea TaxID=106147 RepID=A0A7Y4L9X0_9BURK|nr:T6SS immunity protein Tdi1 domain-containing protein [Pelistega europaea]NOL49699.1 SMI1/KNR4 family protein [Pelistega europaea]
MEIQDLTIPSEHIDSKRLLQNWSWLFEPRLQVVMITKLGDAFLIEPSTGEIFFLDTLDGELESIADSVNDFRELLNDREFVIDYFSLELLAPVIHLAMPENTVYSFKKPPVLGGEVSSDNLELFDVLQHFDDMGRLWLEIDQLAQEMDDEE